MAPLHPIPVGHAHIGGDVPGLVERAASKHVRVVKTGRPCNIIGNLASQVIEQVVDVDVNDVVNDDRRRSQDSARQTSLLE